ncbi:MAG: ABC transporter ATP-binding protein [bacterium]|nr:ABC transporter ATP-binding protein [bacterium]
MLELKDVTKKFGPITAVDNLSFEINEGEIVGLIGPNGSGKTTALKMIAGLYRPTSGKITIKNHDVAKDAEETRALLGYIPDEPAVYSKLTGDEFLNFVGETFGIPADKRQSAIAELHKQFPMEEQTGGYFEDYSRGTRQKFMIMAALLHKSPLLLIDEPIVGLDPSSAHTATRLFSEYAKEDKRAILVSTHSLAVAQELCDRFIVLSKGKMVAQGSLSELRKDAQTDGSLEQIYLKLAE